MKKSSQSEKIEIRPEEVVNPKFVWKEGEIEFKHPEKKRDKVKRVNDYGRANAGSQRQIQTYVNLRPLELAEKVIAQLSLPSSPASSIRWVSPLASKRFAEYRDEDFLCALDLQKHSSALTEFWPKGGPSWDALGILDSPSGGVVMVEAKSHATELQSECKAENPGSRKKIQAALEKTKEWLGVLRSSDWTKPYYQSANRLAFLYFLHSRQIPAWLVNVYFLNDPHFKDPPPPNSSADWEPAIADVRRALGLNESDVPYTAKLFLEASEGY